MKKTIITLILIVTAAVGYALTESSKDKEWYDQEDWSKPYTLYRTGSIYKDMEIEMAIFNAKVSDKFFNKDNCELMAQELNKKTVENKFWCETGLSKRQ
jgi:hypothetical protein